MLRFFSKKRFKLAARNKVGKYLRYAIGEILLVVIGILIALQINNWNENRKQHLKDLDFLKNLKKEISNDITLLTLKKKEFTDINKEIRTSLELFNNSVQLSDSQYHLIGSALRHSEILTPYSKNVVRNDISLSEGVLDRLSPELNNKYILYIEKTKLNNDIVSKLGESLQLVMLHDVNQKTEYNYFPDSRHELDFKFEEIRHDRLIRNALNKSLDNRDFALEYINDQVKLADELLTLINGILESN